MADILEGVEEGIENYLIPEKNSSAPDEVDHDFDAFDNTFITGNGINAGNDYIKSSAICKKFLYIPICEGSYTRAWDVLLLIPNLAFLIFLIVRSKTNRRKLLATNSPVFRAFHLIVGVITVLSILRGIISMSIAKAISFGSLTSMNVDKISWIILEFTMFTSEIVIIGVWNMKVESHKAIKKLFAMAGLISFILHASEMILELEYPDPSYTVHPEHAHEGNTKFDLYGFGGPAFCMSSSACLALIYAAILILPFLPFVKNSLSIAIPNKPGFYQYVTFVLILYTVRFSGAAMIYFKTDPNGMCILNLSQFLYITFYGPFVYAAFLSPFFKTAQPTLLFSYKAQIDDFDEADDMPNASGSMQFSLDQSPQEEVESNPIIRNGSAPVPSHSFISVDTLASPESVTEDIGTPTESFRY